MAVILGLAGVYDKSEVSIGSFIRSSVGFSDDDIFIGYLVRNDEDIKARWRERNLKRLMKSKDKLTHIKKKI